jgi:hypothetical protein
MGLNLLDRIQAKLELFRLEQRYTRRHRRSTFVSNAIYVDGEYIYNTPNTTGSSTNSQNSAAPSRTQTTVESPSQSEQSSTSAADEKARKRMHRWSSMPGFGSSSKQSPTTEDWRMGRVSEDNVR